MARYRAIAHVGRQRGCVRTVEDDRHKSEEGRQVANKSRDTAQAGGIVFGSWKLVPMDSINWELCHWHETTKGNNAGVEQWNRLGRFYQSGTFANAILYAADVELKAKCRDKAVQLADALKEHERIVGELIQAFEKSLEQSA